MDAGLLRNLVDIEQATETRDAAGGVVKTWARIDRRWASIEPLKGREQIEANQSASRITHRIKTRHRPGINTTHRIKHKTRIFNIVSIINMTERDRYDEILAIETL